jgi:hypothetical protein
MKKFETSHTNVAGTFPDTTAIDATGPSTTDGTEYIADGINEEWGWIQALLFEAGITPSGVTESKSASDILDGIKTIIGGKKIQPIDASVAANAMTITLNPTYLDFRSATLGSGSVDHVKVGSAISLVVSSGSTLGTISAVQSRIAVLAINNAGTAELAAINLAGGNDLSETGLISTVAEGGAGAADSDNVFYSNTLRSNVPYKVVGYIESTQATAGAWATAPSTIQGAGGQAFAAMDSIGYGQTWQDLTGSRALATTYYNTTGKPISIRVEAVSAITTGMSMILTVDGVNIKNESEFANGVGYLLTIDCIIPHGSSYNVTAVNAVLDQWSELR